MLACIPIGLVNVKALKETKNPDWRQQRAYNIAVLSTAIIFYIIKFWFIINKYLKFQVNPMPVAVNFVED